MNKKQLNPKQKSRRIAPSACRALILLETEKIRKIELRQFNKNKAAHLALTAQVELFNTEEIPAFQSWLNARCGDLREQASAAYSEFSALQNTFYLANELCNFYPEYTEQECADAAVYVSKHNGEIPKGFEAFFEPEPENDPFGFFEEEENESESAEAREFFESLRGGLSGAAGDPLTSPPPSQAARAKTLYRSITKKLHPDRIGQATPEQQELWHTAKRAYEIDDVETLEHIEAHCELLHPLHNRFAAISSIRSGIQFYKKANARIRQTLWEMRGQPAWGFLSWSHQKKERLVQQITRELNDDLRQINASRTEIQSLLRQMQTPRKKQARGKRSAAFRYPEQDLFELFNHPEQEGRR
jgi:hypothetical protein